MSINSDDDLSDALKRGDSTIEIEGSLADKVIKIKATGQVSWLIAAGAIAIAVYAAITFVPMAAGSGGAAVPLNGAMAVSGATGAVAILGAGATATAIAMAVRARGTGVLSDLRAKYKIVEQKQGHVVLTRL